jgi:methane monooxygenase PmoA-like
VRLEQKTNHKPCRNLLVPLTLSLCILAQPAPRPVPRIQAIPQPDYQVSFERDGREIVRYHFNPGLKRPFLFPVIGPSGRSLTRMGHPRDPEGHSHHNSVWISHHDVNGVSFWVDRDGAGRIVHQRTIRFEDGPDDASMLTMNAWVGPSGTVLLNERRLVTVQALPKDEFMLIIDLALEPQGRDVTFGKTPFGLIGVRMAKTIGVDDGGGVIRNSEGAVDEPDVLWKRARWVDYSGPITPASEEGITLMDHVSNPNHPTYFHVRRDGWMGCSLTFDAPRTVSRNKPLRLRYGLYVHSGMPTPGAIQARWEEFARTPVPDLSPGSR